MKTKTFYLNTSEVEELKLIHNQGNDPVFAESQNLVSRTLKEKLDRFWNKIAVLKGFDYNNLDWIYTEIRESFEANWLKAPITWKELKDFVETLSEEELEKDAVILYDDDSNFTPLLEPSRTEADFYVNKNDPEDVGTLEDLRMAHDQDFEPDDYLLITPKGKPFLWAETV